MYVYNILMERIIELYHYFKALLAVTYYGYPARDLNVIAVTGTSGKTTTSHLIYHLLRASGRKVGLISTVVAIINNKSYDTGFHVTTPEPFALQKFLHLAQRAGVKDMVIEASSHGLAQYRMLGCNINIGVLTNIAHEHLDWHKTFSSYAIAKLSLFSLSKIGLLHKDRDTYSLWQKFKIMPQKTLYTYALNDLSSKFNKNNTPSQVSLPGAYNRENALAAAAVATLLGIPSESISKSLLNFKGVSGRYEEISNKRGYKIIVDFAHKPNALEAFLISLKESSPKRIIVLFGSAGERDIGKRALMGKIAAKNADIIVLTDEDPRTEKPQDIIAQIAKGCLKGGAVESPLKSYPWFIKIPNRSQAIDYVINSLGKKGDILAFLGKSHEKSMCYGKTEIPWSEHAEIHKALNK